jgi:hypothetical protein
MRFDITIACADGDHEHCPGRVHLRPLITDRPPYEPCTCPCHHDQA